MAARKKVHHNPETIERIRQAIKTQRIVESLESCALGEKELTNPQIRAGLGLLAKVMPDLTSAEIIHRKEQQSPEEMIALLEQALGKDSEAVKGLKAQYLPDTNAPHTDTIQ